MQPRLRSPEERRELRGIDGGAPTEKLVSMVIGSYREMPGLCLYLNQAARLFGVPLATCQLVLDQLVRGGTLHRRDNGQYVARGKAMRTLP
jgi:hypothetical protein